MECYCWHRFPRFSGSVGMPLTLSAEVFTRRPYFHQWGLQSRWFQLSLSQDRERVNCLESPQLRVQWEKYASSLENHGGLMHIANNRQRYRIVAVDELQLTQGSTTTIYKGWQISLLSQFFLPPTQLCITQLNQIRQLVVYYRLSWNKSSFLQSNK